MRLYPWRSEERDREVYLEHVLMYISESDASRELYEWCWEVLKGGRL